MLKAEHSGMVKKRGRIAVVNDLHLRSVEGNMKGFHIWFLLPFLVLFGDTSLVRAFVVFVLLMTIPRRK